MAVNHSPQRRSLDETLADVSSWVRQAEDPIRTLTNVACLLGGHLKCDACSLYLLDSSTELLILCGTVGLRQQCVGQIRMSLSEGLTGLVAQRRQAVVAPKDAADHPRFKHFPEAGEDLYESFLGVPILNGPTLIGVLIVQTLGPAQFSRRDVETMIAAGVGLGPLLELIRPAALSRLTKVVFVT